MARSYKKEPWAKIGSPSDKYLASRKLRRQGKFWDLADGAHYKRFYDQWDICDYKWPPMTHVWSHFRRKSCASFRRTGTGGRIGRAANETGTHRSWQS
jgi:hypothetical protein